MRGDLGRIPVERVLWVNLVAGAAAGAAAAVVTHPFDVVKTQVQVRCLASFRSTCGIAGHSNSG